MDDGGDDDDDDDGVGDDDDYDDDDDDGDDDSDHDGNDEAYEKGHCCRPTGLHKTNIWAIQGDKLTSTTYKRSFESTKRLDAWPFSHQLF